MLDLANMGDGYEDDFDDTTMFENKSGLAEVKQIWFGGGKENLVWRW